MSNLYYGYGYREQNMMEPYSYNVKISADDKIISIEQDGSLIAELSFALENNTLIMNGKDGMEVSSVELPISMQSIEKQSYDEEKKAIILDIMQTNGEIVQFELDVEDLVKVYTAGDGISIDSKNTISIKIADGEDLLTVSESGLEFNEDSIATKEYVDDVVAKIELPSLNGYLTEDAADGKYQPKGENYVEYKEFGEGRKTIELKNHDTISGIDTKGIGHNLAMISKWDVADFGASGVHMNLNSMDKISINDGTEEDGGVIASEKFVKDAIDGIVIPKVDLTPYETKEHAEETYQIKGDYVEFEHGIGERKHIILPNHDNILGLTTEGGSVNLAMVSKWNVADFGSNTIHMNLNSEDGNVTINDSKVVATEDFVKESIGGIVIPEVDLTPYETKEHAEETYQIKGDYLTSDALEPINEAIDSKQEKGDYVAYKEGLNGRKHIVLENHNNILGKTTKGEEVNIAMVSKWDVVDLGSSSKPMNLNSTDGIVKINDTNIVATIAQLEEEATERKESINEISQAIINIKEEIEGGISEGNKELSDRLTTLENGIKINQVEGNESNLQYVLTVNGVDCGEINIPKDQVLDKVEYADKKFTFTWADTAHTVTVIDVSDLSDTYVGGDGILVDEDNIIKVNLHNSQFLKIIENGGLEFGGSIGKGNNSWEIALKAVNGSIIEVVSFANDANELRDSIEESINTSVETYVDGEISKVKSEIVGSNDDSEPTTLKGVYNILSDKDSAITASLASEVARATEAEESLKSIHEADKTELEKKIADGLKDANDSISNLQGNFDTELIKINNTLNDYNTSIVNAESAIDTNKKAIDALNSSLVSQVDRLDGAIDVINGNESVEGSVQYQLRQLEEKLKEYIDNSITNLRNELIADAESKYQVKGEYLTSIPEEYVTDTELNTKVEGFATETYVVETFQPKGDYVITSSLDERGYATEDYVKSQVTALDEKTIQELTKKQNAGNYVSATTLDNYVLNSRLDDYVTVTDLNLKNYVSATELSSKNYATVSELIAATEDMATNANIAKIYQPIGSYVTTDELLSKGYITEEVVNTKITTKETEIKSWADNKFALKGDYVTESVLNSKGFVTQTSLDSKEYVNTTDLDNLQNNVNTTMARDYATKSSVASIDNRVKAIEASLGYNDANKDTGTNDETLTSNE